MGGAMLSKSLIQFSVVGQKKLCSLPVVYGGGNEGDCDLLFKRSQVLTAALSAPDLAAGHY